DKLVTGVQTCALPISRAAPTLADALDSPEPWSVATGLPNELGTIERVGERGSGSRQNDTEEQDSRNAEQMQGVAWVHSESGAHRSEERRVGKEWRSGR